MLSRPTKQVKIGNKFSPPGHPNGRVPQGTLLGPKCFLVYINYLETPVPLYKYVVDSTLFELCHKKCESVLHHSVDIAARWTLHNDMTINSDRSKEMLISFMQDPEFRNTLPGLILVWPTSWTAAVGGLFLCECVCVCMCESVCPRS